MRLSPRPGRGAGQRRAGDPGPVPPSRSRSLRGSPTRGSPSAPILGDVIAEGGGVTVRGQQDGARASVSVCGECVSVGARLRVAIRVG